MTAKGKRHIFVDLDQTLIDSTRLTYPVIEPLMKAFVTPRAKSRGLDPEHALREARRQGGGITAVGLRSLFDIDPKEFLRATHPVGLAQRTVARNYGVMAWFAAAPGPCWIASDGPLHYCEEVVDALGISRWVRGIFSLDTMRFIPKASPAYFTELKKRTGVAPLNGVLVDDNLSCLRVARRAGLATVQVGKPGRLPAHASFSSSSW